MSLGLWSFHTRIEIAVGMKAMVMINISTDTDLANGTRGAITDIILDHREQLDKSEIENGIITLMYTPAMTVFKPIESTFPKFVYYNQILLPIFLCVF